MEAPESGLVNTLHTGDSRQRAAAARALAETESPAVIVPLVAALRDRQERVRRAAFEAICRIGGEEAVEGLVRGLLARTSARAAMRALCAEGLGRLGASQALPDLLVALRDADRLVRCAAARAVGRLGDEAVVPALQRLLEDFVVVRVQAVHAIADAGGESSVPLLLELLAHQDPQMRHAAAMALGRVGDARTAPYLLDTAVRSAAGDVSLAAVCSLRKIVERDPDPALRALIPGLRQASAARGPGSHGFSAVCREVIHRIEALTQEIHSLPRPASSSADPATLPRPAAGPGQSADLLPRPGDEPEKQRQQAGGP